MTPSKRTRGVRRLGLLALVAAVMGGLIRVAPAASDDDGVHWSVKTDPKDSASILIAINTRGMRRNEYLSAIRCTVRFLNADNHLLATKAFDVRGTLEASDHDRIEKFASPVSPFARLAGDYMDYNIGVKGGKADEDSSSAAPPPRPGRVAADVD